MEKLVLLQSYIKNNLQSYIKNNVQCFVKNNLQSYIKIVRVCRVLSCVRRARRVLSCVRRARRVLSCVRRAQLALSCVRRVRRVLSCVRRAQLALSCVRRARRVLSCVRRARRVLSCVRRAQLALSCVRRARRVLSCVRRARRVLPCVATGNTAVNGNWVAAIEGGRRRKLASMTQRFFAAGASHSPTSANRWASRLFREDPCTFLDVMCNLTVTWLEFLCCFHARNYFRLPQSPIAAVVSQRINQSYWCMQDHRKVSLPIQITSLL